jgi:hypothetical protein
MANDALAELRTALASDEASIRLVHTYTHGRCAQIFVGKRKATPVIIPSDGQTLADVLAMLGRLAMPEQEQSAAERWVADESVEASDLGRGVAGF